MIKALKYNHHYLNGKSEPRQPNEIFIPDYQIAVSIIDGKFSIVSSNEPRTERPAKLTIFPNANEEERKFIERHLPAKFKNPASDAVVEMEISDNDARSWAELYKLQQKMD